MPKKREEPDEMSAVVDADGAIALPSSIRQKLNLCEGMNLELRLEGGSIRLIPLRDGRPSNPEAC